VYDLTDYMLTISSQRLSNQYCAAHARSDVTRSVRPDERAVKMVIILYFFLVHARRLTVMQSAQVREPRVQLNGMLSHLPQSILNHQKTESQKRLCVQQNAERVITWNSELVIILLHPGGTDDELQQSEFSAMFKESRHEVAAPERPEQLHCMQILHIDQAACQSITMGG
jgi:hypothetical protein